MVSRDVERSRGRSIFAHQLRGSLLALLIAVIAIGSVIYQMANRSLMESASYTLNQQQKEMPYSIEIGGRMQLALVNDTLDLSKFEADKFQVNHTAYSLESLIDEVEQIFAGLAKTSGLGFEVKQLYRPAHLLMGDSRRIGQILINLLSNAMKFAGQGEVVLTVFLDQQRICLSVQDDGVGIDAQLLRSSGYTGPLVAHTADMMQKHQDAFRACGCDDLLTKPIEAINGVLSSG